MTCILQIFHYIFQNTIRVTKSSTMIHLGVGAGWRQGSGGSSIPCSIEMDVLYPMIQWTTWRCIGFGGDRRPISMMDGDLAISPPRTNLQIWLKILPSHSLWMRVSYFIWCLFFNLLNMHLCRHINKYTHFNTTHSVHLFQMQYSFYWKEKPKVIIIL